MGVARREVVGGTSRYGQGIGIQGGDRGTTKHPILEGGCFKNSSKDHELEVSNVYKLV